MNKIALMALLISLVSAQTIDELFRAENGNEWGVEVAEWGYIISAARPRPESHGEISEERAIQISNEFLEKNAKYFGMESINYTQSAQITDREGKKSWVIVYEGQKFKGLPVMDTHTTVIMTLDGKVYAVGNLRYHFETEPIPSAISQEEAVKAAKDALMVDESPLEVKKQIKPVIDEKIEPKIVWNVSFGCPINKNVIVDGDGKIVEVKDSGLVCVGEKNIFWILSLIVLSLAVFLILKKKSKGVAFGFLLIVISLSLISLTLLQKEIYRKSVKKYYIESRIDDMNNLFESIILDLDKAIDITAKRAIAVADSRVISTGIPLENADKIIEELMLNGSINGQEQPLMENATIANWLEKMGLVGREKGYEVRMAIERLEIKPYDSFNLLAEGEAWINISDKNIMASIKRKHNISKTVSIENFEDPIYALNTNSRATKVIKKTRFEGNYTTLLLSCSGSDNWVKGRSFVSNNIEEINSAQNKSQRILVTGDINLIDEDVANQFLGVVSLTDSPLLTVPKVVNCSSISNITHDEEILIDRGKVWSIENLLKHYYGGYYSPSLNGPSFLDRLEGKLVQQEKYKTERITGIESFVNKDYLYSREIPVKDDTNVDYLYFNSTYFVSRGVKGMPESFLIDNELTMGGSHQKYYGVSELLR